MNDTNNQKNSLKNDYIAGFIVILLSIFFVWFVYFVVKIFASYSETVCWNYGFSIGGTLAIGFQIIFLMSGGWEKPINIVVERWKDFFSDLSISIKFAFSSLFENYKSQGIVLLFYIFIMLCTINMCIHGFSYLITLYGI